MDLKELERIVAAGESETVEFKKSTAQLPRAGEALCAFLNGNGGQVLIGISPDGTIAGQEVADKTQREIARMLDRFDPPTPVETEIVTLQGGQRSVVVLRAPEAADGLPFTYDGRPYRRVGTTTSRIPKDRYETLLLERMHARRRWENLPAAGVRIEDLDHEEILRTRDDAIRHRRISAGTSTDVGDILDRLGLRIDGELTQAAQILYGTRFLPDYPQGKLKLGRFRGTKITGDILDNKQEHMHAFAMVREAMAFLDRTLPLPTAQVTAQDTAQVTAQVAAMLEVAAHGPVSRETLQEAARIKHREHFRKAHLEPALNAGLLERTIPDKPRSSKQRYRTTPAGRRVLHNEAPDA